MAAQQLEAKSADGTRVPYFVIGASGVKNAPTMLYGYGGFEIAMEPFYSGALGRAWLARGGVLVIANIRGGGEFGPAWHQAALKEKRQNSFDDFMRLHRDRSAWHAQPKQIGIRGGRNGGLLVGAALTQRPELFGAAVAQVPLLDMQRVQQVVGGSELDGRIRRSRPFRNSGPTSPVFALPERTQRSALPLDSVCTSTRDDRVHPAHRPQDSRAARAGSDVWYYENIEGGHGQRRIRTSVR